jgi:hypothetical protein
MITDNIPKDIEYGQNWKPIFYLSKKARSYFEAFAYALTCLLTIEYAIFMFKSLKDFSLRIFPNVVGIGLLIYPLLLWQISRTLGKEGTILSEIQKFWFCSSQFILINLILVMYLFLLSALNTNLLLIILRIILSIIIIPLGVGFFSDGIFQYFIEKQKLEKKWSR